jgi:hypothetical protein
MDRYTLIIYLIVYLAAAFVLLAYMGLETYWDQLGHVRRDGQCPRLRWHAVQSGDADPLAGEENEKGKEVKLDSDRDRSRCGHQRLHKSNRRTKARRTDR